MGKKSGKKNVRKRAEAKGTRAVKKAADKKPAKKDEKISYQFAVNDRVQRHIKNDDNSNPDHGTVIKQHTEMREKHKNFPETYSVRWDSGRVQKMVMASNLKRSDVKPPENTKSAPACKPKKPAVQTITVSGGRYTADSGKNILYDEKNAKNCIDLGVLRQAFSVLKMQKMIS